MSRPNFREHSSMSIRRQGTHARKNGIYDGKHHAQDNLMTQNSRLMPEEDPLGQGGCKGSTLIVGSLDRFLDCFLDAYIEDRDLAQNAKLVT